MPTGCRWSSAYCYALLKWLMVRVIRHWTSEVMYMRDIIYLEYDSLSTPLVRCLLCSWERHGRPSVIYTRGIRTPGRSVKLYFLKKCNGAESLSVASSAKRICYLIVVFFNCYYYDVKIIISYICSAQSSSSGLRMEAVSLSQYAVLWSERPIPFLETWKY